jgi:hypothetical protein
LAATYPSGPEVEFEPEKEVWSVYDLSDGSVISLKTILLKLYKMATAVQAGSPPPQEQFAANFHNIMVTKRANERLKGTPNPNPPAITNLDTLDKMEVQFTPLVEDWNIYRLVESGDTLKVKLVATAVYRVKNTWDRFGDPLYAVSSANVVQPMKRPTPSSSGTQ